MDITTNWGIFTVLFLLVLYVCKDDLSKIWRSLLLFIHVAAGSRLFQYVMLYTPEKDSSVPEEDRDVMGIVFSNDEEYINKIVKITEVKEK